MNLKKILKNLKNLKKFRCLLGCFGAVVFYMENEKIVQKFIFLF